MENSIEQQSDGRDLHPPDRAGFRPLAVCFRAGCWILLVVVVPHIVIPEFIQMFQEFGLTLPAITEWLIRLCKKSSTMGWTTIPLAWMLIAAFELALASLPVGEKRKRLLIAFSLFLVVLTVIYIVAVLPPLFMIRKGLQG